MEITYYNGNFIPKEEVKISPDDRGFLFADGIYEVVRWYKGGFFDMDNHLARMKRSLEELRIIWPEAERFPSIALDLIKLNHHEKQDAMLYLQVTRGAAKRTHNFPSPDVKPTVYINAWGFIPDNNLKSTGVKVMLKEDIRWARCDIKSISLLANTISFQDAWQKGLFECIFCRNGLITEGSHSNIFFVSDQILYTHPESNFILSGVTRKNIIRIARDLGIRVEESAIHKSELPSMVEAFITNTSAEATPVLEIGGKKIGDGLPGPITKLISERLDAETGALKG